MSIPSRAATTTAVLVGVAVAAIAFASLLLIERQINLLAPVVYGALSGGGTWLAILLWSSRRNSRSTTKPNSRPLARKPPEARKRPGHT